MRISNYRSYPTIIVVGVLVLKQMCLLRKVLATILDLTATSTLVHKGSDTSVQCRLQGSQATPIVSWTGDNSNFEITTTNGDKDVVSEISVEGVSEDVTYTCTFSVQGKKFTEQTQVRSDMFTCWEPRLGNSLTPLRTSFVELEICFEAEFKSS